jgi:hypothetical protein
MPGSLTGDVRLRSGPEPARRPRTVVDVVDAAGGRIDLPYQTFLLLARASD